MLDTGTMPPGCSGEQQAAWGKHAGAVSQAVLVSLVPNSAIQFLDFDAAETAVARTRRRYVEDQPALAGDEPSLHVASIGDDGLTHPLTNLPCDPADVHSIGGSDALAPFLDSWLPLPFMRVVADEATSDLTLDEGPSNWTRVYITRSPEGYRVVLAVDTAIDADTAIARSGRGDLAPTAGDLRAGAAYRFSDDVNDVAWFVAEAWVDEWLRVTYAAGRARIEGRAEAAETARGSLEHLAHYLTVLAVIKECCDLPALRFMEPGAVGPYADTVLVDLALDLGAARTCALLEERQPMGRGRPGQGAVVRSQLPIRDLGEPWRQVVGTFSSRLEFARTSFGNDALSRWSGRSQAFAWPSLVRVGAEAERLAQRASSAEAMTGVSSPLHYVWDEAPARAVWRFAGQAVDSARRNPVVSGTLLSLLAETGDVMAGGQSYQATTKPRFSLSSLMTFFVAEILLHAISAINSPSWRARSSDGVAARATAARRLDRIVIAPPAGMPPPEVEILRGRVEGAVRLVWEALGWSVEGGALSPPPPTVMLVADSATSTQIAYLNGEIARTFRGRAETYLGLVGRARPGFAGARTLRIATLDVGAASSALSIATHELAQGGTLACTRHLVSAFGAGGLDVVKALAERIVLPAIERRLAECKMSEPGRFLATMLTRDDRLRPEWIGDLGRRFAVEIARPAGEALLRIYASTAAAGAQEDAPFQPILGDLVSGGGGDARSISERLDVLAADEGADGFSPLECPVPFLARDLADVVADVLSPMLASAVRAIASFDCDLVLLSGGAGRLPIVQQAMVEGMPLRPDRVVTVAGLRLSSLPAACDAAGRLADPKPFAALGALLQGSHAYGVDGPDLVMRAALAAPGRDLFVTMDRAGLVADDDPVFPPADKDKGSVTAGTPQRSRALSLLPPAAIGHRLLPSAGWPAAPLYVVELVLGDGARRPRLPLRVVLGRAATARGRSEHLSVISAHDAVGNRLEDGDVVVRLKTRAFDEGHWIDTGHLDVDHLESGRKEEQA